MWKKNWKRRSVKSERGMSPFRLKKCFTSCGLEKSQPQYALYTKALAKMSNHANTFSIWWKLYM